MSRKSDKIDMLNRLWRPLGSYGFVWNIFFIPLFMAAMIWFDRGTAHLNVMAALFTSNGLWFLAKAGVREFGKTKTKDVQENVAIERIKADDNNGE